MTKWGIVALVVLFSGSLAAEAGLITTAGVCDLYSGDGYQYAGSAAIGQRRSQRFSPKESSPNYVGATPATAVEKFDKAAMQF